MCSTHEFFFHHSGENKGNHQKHLPLTVSPADGRSLDVWCSFHGGCRVPAGHSDDRQLPAVSPPQTLALRTTLHEPVQRGSVSTRLDSQRTQTHVASAARLKKLLLLGGWPLCIFDYVFQRVLNMVHKHRIFNAVPRLQIHQKWLWNLFIFYLIGPLRPTTLCFWKCTKMKIYGI